MYTQFKTHCEECGERLWAMQSQERGLCADCVMTAVELDAQTQLEDQLDAAYEMRFDPALCVN